MPSDEARIHATCPQGMAMLAPRLHMCLHFSMQLTLTDPAPNPKHIERLAFAMLADIGWHHENSC